jgi:hypothetical protein
LQRVMLRRARQLRRARVESELRVEIAVIAVGVTAEAGMDVAADATGIVVGTVAEIVRHVVVVNGRQRHRGRMGDVWMRCVSGLLRADRGSQRVRTRR